MFVSLYSHISSASREEPTPASTTEIGGEPEIPSQ